MADIDAFLVLRGYTIRNDRPSYAKMHEAARGGNEMSDTPRTDAASCRCIGEGMANYSECCAAEVARTLERENAALREDAERYRWLRERTNCSFGLSKFQLDIPHPSITLDAAIDAARTAATK